MFALVSLECTEQENGFKDNIDDYVRLIVCKYDLYVRRVYKIFLICSNEKSLFISYLIDNFIQYIMLNVTY